MPVRICYLLLLLLPFLSKGQQSEQVQLYLHNQLVASATANSVDTISVHITDTAGLRLSVAPDDTGFIRKVIVMDSKRKGIDSKSLTANACEVAFSIAELYRQSGGEALTFYIVKIPANPVKAALVRVAPRPVFYLQWNK